MIVFPAVDIKEGRCVRLQKGDFNKETVFSDDPVSVALEIANSGAEYLHVIDLDGARGRGLDNSELVLSIAQNVDVPVQTGGGIRTFKKIKAMLDGGVSRVIIGTAAFEDPEFLKGACSRFPGSIAVSVDVRDSRIATKGWQEMTEIQDVDFLRTIEGWGVDAVIYTDIARDGMMEGIDMTRISSVSAETGIPLIVAGGVTRMDDIRLLEKNNIYGAVVGRALYEGRITMDEIREFSGN